MNTGRRYLVLAGIVLGLLCSAPLASAQTYDAYIWETPVVTNIGAGANSMKATLQSEVQKILDAGHLAPLQVALADQVGEGYFQYHEKCRIVTTLAWAYPYMTTAQQSAALTYVNSEFTNYPIWNTSPKNLDPAVGRGATVHAGPGVELDQLLGRRLRRQRQGRAVPPRRPEPLRPVAVVLQDQQLEHRRQQLGQHQVVLHSFASEANIYGSNVRPRRHGPHGPARERHHADEHGRDQRQHRVRRRPDLLHHRDPLPERVVSLLLQRQPGQQYLIYRGEMFLNRIARNRPVSQGQGLQRRVDPPQPGKGHVAQVVAAPGHVFRQCLDGR